MILGTAKTSSQIKIMLLGSGELGREFAISAQRLGIYVIAVDRYLNAPAMHIAHESYAINMQSSSELKKLILDKKPDFIVPEIEAIATNQLIELENLGFSVVPCAKAVNLTMNRQGIRQLASDELGLSTSKFKFAENKEQYENAIKLINYPFVIKPIMSSSGKGQSIVRNSSDKDSAWKYALSGSRGKSVKVIVEQFIEFDYEITLLTVRHKNGISFCEPIGHIQKNGDYQLSWQPHTMSKIALNKAKTIAKEITNALGGFGIFGVELFIKGDDVYFNEVSPRPHDTGLVTLMSQKFTEFDLHLRAILGLPIPNEIKTIEPTASAAILLGGNSNSPSFTGFNKALQIENSQVYLFNKPNINGLRRMGVALSSSKTIDQAKENALKIRQKIKLSK